MPTTVRVFKVSDGQVIAEFQPYGTGYGRGAFIAVGDVLASNPGLEIIVGPGGGRQPVKVLDAEGNELIHFVPYGNAYRGAVRVAIGDVNPAAGVEIVTARAGDGQVRVFDAAGAMLLHFRPYRSMGGVFVTVADVDGDSLAEIITGPEGLQAPRVRIFDGASGAREAQFLAYATGFHGGVRVGVADLDNDGQYEILTAPGPGRALEVGIRDGLLLSQVDVLFPFGMGFRRGIFVAGN